MYSIYFLFFLVMTRCYIYTGSELHYNEGKANKGDIHESNIIDDRYFSAAHCFIHNNLGCDRRPCRGCGCSAGKHH